MPLNLLLHLAFSTFRCSLEPPKDQPTTMRFPPCHLNFPRFPSAGIKQKTTKCKYLNCIRDSRPFFLSFHLESFVLQTDNLCSTRNSPENCRKTRKEKYKVYLIFKKHRIHHKDFLNQKLSK